MEKEMQNRKQLWSEPQMTEIEVKMTEVAVAPPKNGTGTDALGPGS